MKEKLLSVIVPAYNVEKYIERCIFSILNQSYINLEIIIVDDGSTDETAKVIDEFAKKDSRVKVITKKNEGLVKARKDGISISTGDYITFVDSDDWIEADMYEVLINRLIDKDVDLITSGLLYDCDSEISFVELDLLEDGQYGNKEIVSTIVPKMMLDFENNRRGITSSVVNKIFKRDLLLPVLDRLDNNISYGEDAAITYSYILCCNKITIVRKAWYHYCIRQGSMARTFDEDALKKIKLFYAYMAEVFEEKNILSQMKYQLERYTHNFIIDVENKIFGKSGNEIRYIFPYEDIEKDTDIVIYGAGKVGLEYYKSIRCGNYANIVLWTDRNYVEYQKAGIPVSNPKQIKNIKYDYIVVAIDNKSVADEIQSYLVANGVEKEKIVWKQNKW